MMLKEKDSVFPRDETFEVIQLEEVSPKYMCIKGILNS